MKVNASIDQNTIYAGITSYGIGCVRRIGDLPMPPRVSPRGKVISQDDALLTGTSVIKTRFIESTDNDAQVRCFEKYFGKFAGKHCSFSNKGRETAVMVAATATAAGQKQTVGDKNYRSVADGPRFVWIRDTKATTDSAPDPLEPEQVVPAKEPFTVVVPAAGTLVDIDGKSLENGRTLWFEADAEFTAPTDLATIDFTAIRWIGQETKESATVVYIDTDAGSNNNTGESGSKWADWSNIKPNQNYVIHIAGSAGLPPVSFTNQRIQLVAGPNGNQAGGPIGRITLNNANLDVGSTQANSVKRFTLGGISAEFGSTVMLGNISYMTVTDGGDAIRMGRGSHCTINYTPTITGNVNRVAIAFLGSSITIRTTQRVVHDGTLNTMFQAANNSKIFLGNVVSTTTGTPGNAHLLAVLGGTIERVQTTATVASEYATSSISQSQLIGWADSGSDTSAFDNAQPWLADTDYGVNNIVTQNRLSDGELSFWSWSDAANNAGAPTAGTSGATWDAAEEARWVEVTPAAAVVPEPASSLILREILLPIRSGGTNAGSRINSIRLFDREGNQYANSDFALWGSVTQWAGGTATFTWSGSPFSGSIYLGHNKQGTARLRWTGLTPMDGLSRVEMVPVNGAQINGPASGSFFGVQDATTFGAINSNFSPVHDFTGFGITAPAGVNAGTPWSTDTDYVGTDNVQFDLTLPATDTNGPFVTSDDQTLTAGNRYSLVYAADRTSAASPAAITDSTAGVAEVALMVLLGEVPPEPPPEANPGELIQATYALNRADADALLAGAPDAFDDQNVIINEGDTLYFETYAGGVRTSQRQLETPHAMFVNAGGRVSQYDATTEVTRLVGGLSAWLNQENRYGNGINRIPMCVGSDGRVYVAQVGTVPINVNPVSDSTGTWLTPEDTILMITDIIYIKNNFPSGVAKTLLVDEPGLTFRVGNNSHLDLLRTIAADGTVTDVVPPALDSVQVLPVNNGGIYDVHRTGDTLTVIERSFGGGAGGGAVQSDNAIVPLTGADHNTFEATINQLGGFSVDADAWSAGQWFTVSNMLGSDRDITFANFNTVRVFDGDSTHTEINQFTLTLSHRDGYMVRVWEYGGGKHAQAYKFGGGSGGGSAKDRQVEKADGEALVVDGATINGLANGANYPTPDGDMAVGDVVYVGLESGQSATVAGIGLISNGATGWIVNAFRKTGPNTFITNAASQVLNVHDDLTTGGVLDVVSAEAVKGLDVRVQNLESAFDDASSWEANKVDGYQIGNKVVYTGSDAADGLWEREAPTQVPEPAVFEPTSWIFRQSPLADNDPALGGATPSTVTPPTQAAVQAFSNAAKNALEYPVGNFTALPVNDSGRGDDGAVYKLPNADALQITLPNKADMNAAEGVWRVRISGDWFALSLQPTVLSFTDDTANGVDMGAGLPDEGNEWLDLVFDAANDKWIATSGGDVTLTQIIPSYAVHTEVPADVRLYLIDGTGASAEGLYRKETVGDAPNYIG